VGDGEREWLAGTKPGHTCMICGAAAGHDLCLEHLDDAAFESIVRQLRDGAAELDLRGVAISNARWSTIRAALTPHGHDGPNLSRGLLTQATFGDRVDLSDATFGDGANLGNVTFGDGVNLGNVTFGAGAKLSGATFGDEANLGDATFGNGADLVGVTFGAGADLSGARFGDGAKLSGARLGARANMMGATFGISANLRGATFGDRANVIGGTFGDGADLSHATFGNGADLSYATFGDSAYLRHATFSDGANLHDATFGDSAGLSDATFGDSADLSHATFGDQADLSGATFGDWAALHDATFGEGAVLVGATFGDDASLRRAAFGDRAYLSRTTFGDRADLSCATFGDQAALFRATFGAEMNLVGAKFGDGADLVDAWFVGDVALGGVRLAGQQRSLGPLYAGGTVDLYDAQFGAETRLEIDASRVVLSRVVFGGPAEIRVLRAAIEASETTFSGRAAIAILDEARRPAITTADGTPRKDAAGNELHLAAATQAVLWSLRRTDVAHLTIAGVRVDETRFAGAQSLEKLRLLDTAFAEHRGRQRVREERLLDELQTQPTADEQRIGHPACTSDQVADIYRSLRKSREDAADAPGGNDLYVGELLMRRRALRKPTPQTIGVLARRVLLTIYGWIGGYGVRPGRPLAALLVLLAVALPVAGHVGLRDDSVGAVFVFVFRSVLLLPTAHNPNGDALQIVLRLVAPVLIALIALGVRAQIKR
jgi:hypothetical protein